MEIEKVEVEDTTYNFYEFLVKTTLKDGRIIYFTNCILDEDWKEIREVFGRGNCFTAQEKLSLKYNLKPVFDKKCKEFFKKRIEENNKKIKTVTFDYIDTSHLI